MQAIILAAGMGKRLQNLTKENTKCMVKVNGVTLIERMLGQLDALGLSRIILVIGYKGQELRDFVGTLGIATPTAYIENPVYDKTNNIYSLSLAKELLVSEDTILLESDIIFEDSVLKELVEDTRDTLVVVDRYQSWMDGTCIQVGEQDEVQAIISGRQFCYADAAFYYKTVNIYKFSRQFSKRYYVPFMTAYTQAMGNNEYYEQVLRVISVLDDSGIRAKRLHGQAWYEIDDVQDLDIAESIFSRDYEKLARLQTRYGGYWRYPQLSDFCYLVNPYYPSERLQDEMKASFGQLLTQYPSGQRVNNLLAAKNFGVGPSDILLGNGAAELINGLMQVLQGNIGLIRPTFEEYSNRYTHGRQIVYDAPAPDFQYGIQELMDFFQDKQVSAIVLINPDNPSGNYISRQDIRAFAGWCQERNIRLVLDESFVDFACETDAGMIEREVLRQYPTLVIIKSVSKSYGVPGLRLGIMVSADRTLLDAVSDRLSIWNINSFAEFYMQIAGKYQQEYREALCRFCDARQQMQQELSEIPGVRVIPSQANYFMLQLTGGMPAAELTGRLLNEHNILIKDLSSKISANIGQYVRVAVRDQKENEILVDAIRNIMCKK